MIQLKKDRLIEKFMGWHLALKSNIGWVFVNEDGYESSMTTYSDSVLGFTTDWNLLIKALKKFDELNDENRVGFTFNEYQIYCDHCDSIDYAVTLYNINDAVNALCEGIEWYNSTLN